MYNTLTNKIVQPLTTDLINSYFNKNYLHLDSNYLSSNYVESIYKDNSYILKYKFAGYEKDEIEINTLSLASGNRTLTVKASNSEYGSLTYYSRVPLNIDEKLTKATLKNGVLTITFFSEKKSNLSNLKIQVE